MLVVQTNIDPRLKDELKSQIRQSSDVLFLEKCTSGNSSVRCSHGSNDVFLYPDVRTEMLLLNHYVFDVSFQ